MTTCQYYLKRTNNPRICNKKAKYTKDVFLKFGVCEKDMPDFDLHLCHKHFVTITNQIRRLMELHHPLSWTIYVPMKIKLESLLLSVLVIDAPAFDDIALVQLDKRIISSKKDNDDEEKNEDEILAFKFEKAQRDGRYIDLTVVKMSCPICLDNFLPQNVTFLECAHSVCKDCISDMMQHHIRKCPICRHPF